MVKLSVTAQSATSDARFDEGMARHRARHSATEAVTLKPTITVVGYICHAIGHSDPADWVTPQIRLPSQVVPCIATSIDGFIDDKLSSLGLVS